MMSTHFQGDIHRKPHIAHILMRLTSIMEPGWLNVYIQGVLAYLACSFGKSRWRLLMHENALKFDLTHAMY